MKKIIFSLITLTAITLVNNVAHAQTKMGFFDENIVISLMPGIQKIDTLLNQFNQDSLEGEYQYNLSEFQRKDNALKADSTSVNKMPASQKSMMTNDRNLLAYKLARWDDYKQNRLRAKQQELLEPYMQKIRTAFQQVIIEGKYAYVFRAENLYYAPPVDDLVPAVCKKLKINLPDAYFGQQAGDGNNNKPKPGKRP